MYCPTCFQNTMKIKSNGVVKLAFNGKSKNSSLFTYNLQKETHEQQLKKLQEKIVDFFSFYSEFKNRTPMKSFEAFTSDVACTNSCKIDLVNTRVSVIGVLFSIEEITKIMQQEGQKYQIPVELSFK